MDGKSVGGHKIYQNCQTYKFIFGRVSVLRGLCNLYKMEGIFLRLIASSKPSNFTIFSWKVFVSRGPCYKDIMGGFFLPPDFRQIRQTFKIFGEGWPF